MIQVDKVKIFQQVRALGYCQFLLQQYRSIVLNKNQSSKELIQQIHNTYKFHLTTIYLSTTAIINNIPKMKLLRNPIFKNTDLMRRDFTKVHVHKPSTTVQQTVTMIPGYGVGKQICNSVKHIFSALNVPISFDLIDDFSFENPDHKQKVKKNKTILLGVMAAEKGLNPNYNDNFKFYKWLDLYANVNLAFSVPTIQMRHQNVDIAIVRQNTQGEFSGIEHEVYPGVMQSLKVTTREASERLIRYAFEFAQLSGRKKITVVHKANIMKLVDGLFINTAKEISKEYPFIKYQQMIVDNASMQLVKNPSQFDVIVTSNLYGSILTHICSGITGKVGMTPGAFIGKDYALFSRALPRTGIRMAGKNQVNPTSMILSAVMMLRYLNLPYFADAIGESVKKVLNEGKVRTGDIGGCSTTTEFTKEIIRKISV